MILESLLTIIRDDNLLIEKLIEWNVIPSLEEISCLYCGNHISLRIRKRKDFSSFFARCKSCRKESSIFKNTFFSFENEETSRLKLPVQKVLKLIYFYLEGRTHQEISSMSGIRSPNTIVKWCNLIREACHEYLENEMIGGEGEIVQIDESLMRGYRKNNKGRYLLGDILNLDPTENSRRSNYGQRIDGPWVFGMVEKGTRKVKIINVPDRKASTLIPILRKHVHPQSTIWSDEWRGYVSVKDYSIPSPMYRLAYVPQ